MMGWALLTPTQPRSLLLPSPLQILSPDPQFMKPLSLVDKYK